MITLKNNRLPDQFYAVEEADFYLEQVKKQFAQSFYVDKSHLSAWLSWHEAAQGKWLRARLALSSGHQLGLSAQTCIIWAVVCELIHSASLLHDDVCDKDEQRRGKAALWKEFGIPAAICTGDFLIAESFRKLTEIEQGWHQTILLKLLSCTVKEIIFGQSQDVTYQSFDLNSHASSWQLYTAIATQKTAPLISLPIMGMLHCAEQDVSVCDSLKNIADNLGFAYQLLNDLENILYGEKPEDVKLTLQKKSVPKKSMPSDILYGRINGVVIQSMLIGNTQEKAFLLAKSNKIFAMPFVQAAVENSFVLLDDALQKADALNYQLPVVLAPILLLMANEIRQRAMQLQLESVN